MKTAEEILEILESRRNTIAYLIQKAVLLGNVDEEARFCTRLSEIRSIITAITEESEGEQAG